GHHHPQRRAERPADDLVRQRDEVDANVAVVRVLLLQSSTDGVEVGDRAREGVPGLEAGGGGQPGGRTPLLGISVDPQWEPNDDVASWKGEAARHHADDGSLAPVEPDLPPEDVRVAGEESRPEAVAQDDDAVTALLVLPRGKGTP